MDIKDWKYYNHAAIPTTPPHISPDLSPVQNGDIWNINGKPLLVRWTSEWDCGRQTDWWYVIKDKPFDISAIKSKHRYQINKGNKYFEIRRITPLEYFDELYEVLIQAFSVYPKSYRPNVSKDGFLDQVKSWKGRLIYGAFSKQTNKLCGFASLYFDGICIYFDQLKVFPESEKFSINAAMVNGLLVDLQDYLKKGYYICDGSRNINHQTAFQDYLIKYFLFRKAYCKLNVIYSPQMKTAVKFLFPIRKILLHFDCIGIFHKINAILKMEDIRRKI